MERNQQYNDNNGFPENRKYAIITESTRVNLVKDVIFKKRSLIKASRFYHVKYYTARAIVRNYKKSGIVHTPKTIKRRTNGDNAQISQNLQLEIEESNEINNDSQHNDDSSIPQRNEIIENSEIIENISEQNIKLEELNSLPILPNTEIENPNDGINNLTHESFFLPNSNISPFMVLPTGYNMNLPYFSNNRINQVYFPFILNNQIHLFNYLMQFHIQKNESKK